MIGLRRYWNGIKCYSACRKNEILPFAVTWMDSENVILSEASSDKERQIYDITYMRNLKINTNESTYKTETDSQTQKRNRATKGEREGGRNRIGEWDKQKQTTKHEIDKQ